MRSTRATAASQERRSTGVAASSRAVWSATPIRTSSDSSSRGRGASSSASRRSHPASRTTGSLTVASASRQGAHATRWVSTDQSRGGANSPRA
nr:hypothetical protein HEP87_25895 [Streptomyces sp. S1D4-11]